MNLLEPGKKKSFQLMILSLTLVSRLYDSLFSYTHQCESIKPDRRVKTAHSFMTIKSSTFLLVAFHTDDIVMEVIVIHALRSYWTADLSCRPVKIAALWLFVPFRYTAEDKSGKRSSKFCFQSNASWL